MGDQMQNATPKSPTATEETLTDLEFIAAHRRGWVPESGYNLVGPDYFLPPCDQMYLLGHYATREQAEAARKILRGGGERALIYGPADE